MKRLLTALVLTGTLFNASAEEWTDSEKLIFGASTAALVVDWTQTRRAISEIHSPKEYWNSASVNYKWHETNPLLGERPSASRVNNYFAGAIIGNYLVADNLKEYRTAWLLGVTLLEVAVIIHNKRLGISWGF